MSATLDYEEVTIINNGKPEVIQVTWRPINNQPAQKKSSGGWINISPFWSLCIITMFLIGVAWILNGGKPLT